MDNKILYADFEINSKTKDMFVITPEGNYINFPGSSYDENHPDEQIIDTKSHKIYIVKFNE